MRGGRRRGGGNGSSAKDFASGSPSSKMKDHRSERHHYTFPHRPQRSLSPAMGSRLQQSPSHQRDSPERREYAPGRSNHANQSRSQPAPFEEEGYGYRQEYMLDPNPGVKMGSKPFSMIKDADLHDYGSSAMASTGLGGKGKLLQNSMFYTMPPNTGYLSSTTSLKPENMGSGGYHGSEMLQSHDRPRNPTLKSESMGGSGFHGSEMLANRDRPRDPYDEREREQIYPKNISFSLNASSRATTFGGSSSSNLAKDALLDLYHDRLPHSSIGFSTGVGVSKLPEDSVERNGYGQMLISDPTRRVPLRTPAGYGPQDYMYSELNRSKRSDQGSLVAEKVRWGNRGDLETISTSFMPLGDNAYRAAASHKNSSESSLWDQHRSLHGHAAVGYRDMRAVREDYACDFGSGHDVPRMKPSRDHDVAPFEDRYALTREAAPIAYRERPRSPVLPERHLDMHQRVLSPFQGMSLTDDMDVYDRSSERRIRGKYSMYDDGNQIDSRGVFSNDRSVFRRMQSPSGDDEMWSVEDRVEFQRSERGQPRHRMATNRKPRSDGWFQSGDSSAHTGGRGMSVKRRLRPGPFEFHGSFPSQRRHHDFSRPYKYWKKGAEDHHTNLDTHKGNTHHDAPPLPKTDPPEDSEEFKHQVHKAFLRFSKLLNETSHQQERYREQGKAGTLLCSVCGSLSKEFVDTHSLVTHTYNSFKVGLKTDHLGLHKALCILMGWNWLMPPDNARAYQTQPLAEAKALKEDLILWPPIVIMHSSFNGAKVATIEGMEEILRDMGFVTDMTRVSEVNSGDQSVLLIKFMPTFSGLQEAERLHKHYADKSCGRQLFEQITTAHGGNESREDRGETMEEVLYGYMAVAEDLSKLDPATKKRCLVKSKKDIEAIADAPLNAV